MNQIKQKIEEIGLSQREISKRLGKNASYLAGVFRTGLSTAKQAELLKDLDVVVCGGTVQSYDEIIADLSWKLTDCQDGNKQLRDRLSESQSYLREANSRISVLSKYNDHLKEGNWQLHDESGKYFNETQVLDTELCRVNKENNMLCGDLQKLKRDTANLLDKNRAELSVKQKQLTQTQKYLMVANQNCELFETKYRKIALSNWALCIALVVVLILWVVV